MGIPYVAGSGSGLADYGGVYEVVGLCGEAGVSQAAPTGSPGNPSGVWSTRGATPEEVRSGHLLPGTRLPLWGRLSFVVG